jgi:hypothetical protein
MGALPITSRRERSTGLMNPSVFHTPHVTGVYFGSIATGVIYNDGRGFRRWKLGSAMQLHQNARDTQASP